MTNDTIALLNSEIFYKTVGDHATMLPEKIRYTLPTQTGTLTPTTCVDYTYDESGNITSITYTGHGNSMAYTYDKFNRLIREDDKELRRAMVYTYDGDGNITSKQQMVYQTETPAPGVNAITYTYSNGKMTKYNGLTCSYDAVGNPTVYKGQRATWTKGRKLASYRNTTFTYDGRGRRISKNSTTYTYDSADRLIKTSNGMEFFYDQEGVAGFTYGGAKYCYQKDLQGNIIGIIDNAGQVVVQYKYDAWGMPRGTTTVSTEYSTIASLNPFRYRGYIYDSETGFYYLQSRYYDPETCRFLNMDKVMLITYLGIGILNGLNMYSYCFNNPVMFIDLGGFFPIHVLNKRDPYIRIDDVGTGYEHVHIEYNGKKYSWYKDSHKTRHEGRDHGLNDVSKTMKKKLQELGVSDDYFQQILLEDFSRWQEGMSMKLPEKWQEGMSMNPSEKWQEGMSMKPPEKWQEGMSMKPPEKWQEGVDIPPEVAIGGLVVVVVIIAVALAFFTQGQSLWLLATV